jgi:hypothetical protein
VLDETNTNTIDLLGTWNNAVVAVLDEEAPVKAFPYRKHKAAWMNQTIRNLM